MRKRDRINRIGEAVAGRLDARLGRPPRPEAQEGPCGHRVGHQWDAEAQRWRPASCAACRALARDRTEGERLADGFWMMRQSGFPDDDMEA